MTAAEQPPETERRPSQNRRVIHATCTSHGGAVGFTNLAVIRRGGVVVLDPHVTGFCVIVLDEEAAAALRDVLGEWLG
ncbi:MAG: hypothetical protein ACRDRR_17510 [Pseudonocardiaceae bacterium]